MVYWRYQVYKPVFILCSVMRNDLLISCLTFLMVGDHLRMTEHMRNDLLISCLTFLMVGDHLRMTEHSTKTSW